MAVTGIIAEFNPLHSGHMHIIEEAKKHGTVVCVISGNFVQRGDTAIAEKRIRAEAALRCGVDLVLELPVCWAMSTAQNFALGGVAALAAAGCDTLLFGSECGNVQLLYSAALTLEGEEYKSYLSQELKKGITFAAARNAAAVKSGADGSVFVGANNNLAVEYILAARRLGVNFKFTAVKRLGEAHDSEKNDGGYVSSSLLRKHLLAGDREFCSDYMADDVLKLFKDDNLADIKRAERAIMAVLRTRSFEELAKLPDLSEGIENKLFSAIRLATGLEELYNIVKVKRYTLARIRRLALSAFLGIDCSFFLKKPPYIRVLGFNGKGEQLLKSRKNVSDIPLLVRAGNIENESEAARRIFEIENRATNLYSLALPKPFECGYEYTAKLIKTE